MCVHFTVNTYSPISIPISQENKKKHTKGAKQKLSNRIKQQQILYKKQLFATTIKISDISWKLENKRIGERKNSKEYFLSKKSLMVPGCVFSKSKF